MEDFGEKHIRLVYFLANGCTKMARALVEKLVELSKPPGLDQSSSEWSLDDFLYDNMSKLSKVKGEQRYKLFPGRHKDTNIDEWDLNLLCHVILSCAQYDQLKQDINQLKRIRNEVYHAGSTNIETPRFQGHVGVIEVVVERCCKFIENEEFTQDMKEVLENFKNGQISKNDEDRQRFIQWYEEDPTAEILRKIDGLSQDNQLLMNKMDELLQSAGLKGVVLPGTNVELIVKNCDKVKEKVISDHLVNILNLKIEADITAEDREKILQAAKDAMSELLAGGRELTDIYQACVNMTIKCPSYKNMRALWEDCMTGRLTKVFKTLENSIRLLSGCPDIELEVGITQFEFYRCLEAIETEIAKILRVGNEDIFKSQTDTFREINVKALDTENIEKSAGDSIGGFGDSLEETDGTHIRLQIQPTTFCQAENLWEAFLSGSFNKKLEKLANVFRNVFHMEELRITGKMEEASPYEDLFRKRRRKLEMDEQRDEDMDGDKEEGSFDHESWTEAADPQPLLQEAPSADGTISGRIKSLCLAHQKFQNSLGTLATYLNKLDTKFGEKQDAESNLQDTQNLIRDEKISVDAQLISIQNYLRCTVSDCKREIEEYEDKVAAMRKKLQEHFKTIKDVLGSVLPDLRVEIKREQAELANKYIEFISSEMIEILASWCSDVGYVLYEMKEKDIVRWKELEKGSVEGFSDGPDNVYLSASCYVQETFLDLLKSTFMVTSQSSYCIRLHRNQTPKITISFLALNRIDLRGVTVKAICMKENDGAFTKTDVNEHIPGHLKLKDPEKHISRMNMSEPFEVTYDRIEFEMEDYERLFKDHSQTSFFEQLYRFVFFTSIEGQTFCALSLPVVVTTDPRQSCCALASVMWHCYKTDVFSLPLKQQATLQWSHVAEMLKTKFLRLCPTRTLTDGNLTHLKRRLLGNEHVPDNTQVTLKRFCYEPMNVNCNFSFWKWCLGNYNLVDAYLRPYWQEGLIEGFVSRGDVEKMYGELSTVKTGTFLLRFSDNHITDSVGTKSVFGILTSMVALRVVDKGKITTRLEAIEVANHTKLRSRSLADILKDSMDKSHVNHIYRFVFPGDRRRNECFDKLCSEDQGLSGYIGKQGVFIIDLEQQMLALNIPRSRLGSGSSGSSDSGICPTPTSPRSLSPVNTDKERQTAGGYYHPESILELPVSLSTPTSPTDETLNARALFLSESDGTSSKNKESKNQSEATGQDSIDASVAVMIKLAKDSPKTFSNIMGSLFAYIEKDELEKILKTFGDF